MQLILLISIAFFFQSNAESPTKIRIPLMREGTRIVEAIGHLTVASESQPIMIELEQIGKSTVDTVIVLPNQRLAEMEATHNKTPNSTFRVSGDVYAYGNRNYLLVREAVSLVGHAERDRPAVVPIDPNAQMLTPDDSEDSVSDIVKELEEATGPLVRSIRTAAEFPIKSSNSMLEGTRIVARRCNLIRNDAGAWIAIFVADATGLSDPPCTILPGAAFARLTSWASKNTIDTPVLLSEIGRASCRERV